jgi:hypothetical protein
MYYYPKHRIDLHNAFAPPTSPCGFASIVLSVGQQPALVGDSVLHLMNELAIDCGELSFLVGESAGA